MRSVSSKSPMPMMSLATHRKGHSMTTYARRCAVGNPAKDQEHIIIKEKDTTPRILLRRSILIPMIIKETNGTHTRGIITQPEPVLAKELTITSIRPMGTQTRIIGTLRISIVNVGISKKSSGLVEMLVSTTAILAVATSGDRMTSMTKSIENTSKSFTDSKKSTSDNKRRLMKGPEKGIPTRMSELRRH